MVRISFETGKGDRVTIEAEKRRSAVVKGETAEMRRSKGRRTVVRRDGLEKHEMCCKHVINTYIKMGV